ncbi:SDR family NAD(P)-dependent oxidoreductase [Natronomonas sp. CBA1123]|uniref:SDR family NAD(P)-dependent oxidoreductase n=1 Tax=Natronomonas sp. CBA1123 TaxID=2668070 RepID=UPI0012EA0DB2|nr:SDR family NAD(P)-dependent oxidoreductase [Natronomonas sp. CBA1123]MUV88279.1 SDR family NAD(P)-dependent oxidoreductase [Natronomonas sp. CBA1123]
MPRTAVIAGVGPGLGTSIAERFAEEGCSVALLARSEAYLDDLATRLRAETPGDALAVSTDLAEPSDIEAAFAEIRDALGNVDVLVNHASAASWDGLLEQSTDDFRRAMAVGPEAAFRCSQEAVSDMLDGDGGTVIFTGATTSVRGRTGSVGFSAAKFASRGLAQSMAQELGSEGVHVAHVVLDGVIRPPGGVPEDETQSYLDPDAIAERYWSLVEQSTDTMDFEVHLTNGDGTVEFL